MSKLGLIVKREYLTRVKKKSFILTTLLTPIGFALLFIVPAIIAMNNSEETKKIVVVDDSGYVVQRDSTGRIVRNIQSSEEVTFEVATDWEATLKSYEADGFDGALHIPRYPNINAKNLDVQYISDGQIALGTKSFIERRIETAIRDQKILQSGYDAAILDNLKTDIDLVQRELVTDESGNLVEEEKASSTEVSTALGYIMAFIIYIIMLVYGGMVMRSVMEEKTNRIVEVIISSVKPFQLMMGKILGVSAVGLTQILLWVILIPVLLLLGTTLLGLDPAAMQEAQSGMPGGMSAEQQRAMEGEMFGMLQTLQAQNWSLIIPLFIVYFLGGYFIYASLFAAVGSAAGDDIQDSQSLTFPIMIPIILSIVLIGPIVENPNGSLAFWMSMIPLFSPVIMPARIPFEPPMWEILLSVVILIASAIGFVWMSARIYRVGILLYGKKITFKELGKWLFYKG